MNKQSFKQLLWFIVPTILISVFICIVTFVKSEDLPKFLSHQDFLTTTIRHDYILKALINRSIASFLICLAISFVFYIIKIIMKRKNKQIISTAFYAMTLLISSLVFYFHSHLVELLGLPPSVYASFLIVNSQPKLSFMNLPVILISLQVGIVICFIYWGVDKIKNFIGFHRLRGKKYED